MTRTLSIAIKENTYQELKSKIGLGKISAFVNQAVEKELAKEQRKEKAELKEKLVAAYKRMARNKKLQKELAILSEASVKDMAKKFTQDE